MTPKHGFMLIEERELKEVGGVARLWRHERSGAELLSIANADKNKCFGVSFYTPPTDSSGVAHILEHSVLCGSDKYPVREPFVELLKGSLQTFLNAFTFPDKTCYPVASANLQDFYNLIDVYLDAVFHPRLSEQTFAQEGWHLEADSVAGPWQYKGVVYNEMKGVYSQGESMLAEQSQQAVFPANLYSLDSGGNPAAIPNLSYRAFKDFHERCYQPGNARFFFWGDDPEDERLKIAARAIGDAGPAQPLPQVELQPKPLAAREVADSYPAAAGETKAMFTLNWLLGERGDVREALRMEMLEHILEGLPGSPLRRALTESGLGEDTIGCGLETDLRQMYYSTGLKGIDPEKIDTAKKLILDTLERLAAEGIEPQAVEAAVNSVEFEYRESNSGRFPRGLAAMIQALSTWLYGEDPLAPLAWEKPLAEIRAAIAGGEKLFEDLIRRNFLAVPPITVKLLPDADLAQARLAAERRSVAARERAFSERERQKLVAWNQELRAAQLKPDNPEDLAKIPTLKIKDLPARNAVIPMRVEKGAAATSITHELATNGIAYANLLLPVEELPARLLPALPLFARSLLEWGSARRDYSQLGMRIAAKTGGISAGFRQGLRAKKPFLYFTISGKAVYGQFGELMGLFEEILLEPQNNPPIMLQRLGEMLLEDRARLEYSLQAAGHATAGMRLAARFSPEAALAEQMGGITQLRYLDGLAARLEGEPESVLADFELLRRILVHSRGAIFDYAAEGDVIDGLQTQGARLLARLPQHPEGGEGSRIASLAAMRALPAAEAFITQGQVNYVGKAANLYDLGYSYHGSANVITRWLRMGRLWEEVRVAGGAYGVFCGLDRFNGTFLCTSYRDPNVENTLKVYDGLGAYLESFTPTEAQLTQAVIGAVGDLDTYLLPDAQASLALGWHLTGQTEASRQQMREEMLGTTAADFRNFAQVMRSAARNGAICVLGGQTAANAAEKYRWEQSELA